MVSIKKAEFKLLNTSNNKIIEVFVFKNEFFTQFEKIRIVNNKVFIDGIYRDYLKVINN